MLLLTSCSVDTDAEAPYTEPPGTSGCGSTADLLPRLNAFVAEGRYAPLREIVVEFLEPSPQNPQPDPSWRSVVDALLSLIRQLGLQDTAIVAEIAADPQLEDQLGPLVQVVLEFIDGRVDGVKRYEVADATGFFVDRCDTENLLATIEGALRLQSPSTGQPWVVALLEALQPLLDNPTLRPFLTSFEQGDASGRPAIVGVLRQVMAFLADDDFAISRVQTLLDSAVYPLADAQLERDVQRVVDLFAEATDPAAGILPPLQDAMQCGMRYPERRDVLLGFLYDLLVAPEVGLERVLEGAAVLELDVVTSQLDLLAEALRVGREDERVRGTLRDVIVLLLRTPQAERVVPVLIGFFEEELLTELLAAVVQLLEGCGRVE